MVVALFFLCTALGNVCGGRLVRGRTTGAARLFILAELLSAGWSFTAYLTIGYWSSLLDGWPSTAATACLALTLLGPAVFLSGMGLPALAQSFARADEDLRVSGGAFYWRNLLGAALGILAGGLLLPFLIGYRGALTALCLLQALVAVIAWLKFCRRPSSVTPTDATRLPGALPPAPATTALTVRLVVIGSGVLSIGLELGLLHVMRILLGTSLYGTAGVLFAFLIHLGIGAWLARRWCSHDRGDTRHLWAVLTFSGLGILGLAWLCRWLVQWSDWQQQLTHAQTIGLHLLAPAVLLAPLLIGVGAVFPLSWARARLDHDNAGPAMGRILAGNKCGAALGSLLVPFVLLPRFEIAGTLGWLATGYLFLALLSIRHVRPLVVSTACVSLAALACALFPPSLFLLNKDELLIAEQTGPEGLIQVVESAEGSRHLVYNRSHALNGTSRGLLSQHCESWIPLTLSPAPDRVLFIGMGSGSSAEACLDFPVQHLAVAELSPVVAKLALQHFSPWNARLQSDPRVSLHIEDGRKTLLRAQTPWDVIIFDQVHPWHESSAQLYSRDFFEDVSGRLANQGLFCPWLPGSQLDGKLARIILRTFAETFPHAIIVRANYDPVLPVIGLIGSRSPIDFSRQTLAARLGVSLSPGDPRHQSPFFISPAAFHTALIGDLHATPETTLGDSPVNTHDNGRFGFLATRIQVRGSLRGFSLLHEISTPFSLPAFPSLAPGSTPSDQLMRAVRAGNYYYAAACTAIVLPAESVETTLRRQREHLDYLAQARALLPEAILSTDQLNQ
ncbi:MAG: hypothetical protein K0R17_3669 [Rariglobus sp.]|nr:hypothetical protein [Rariglobus sp.]